MKLKRSLSIALPVLLLAVSVQAANSPKAAHVSRPCLASDLTGTWLMKSITGTIKIDKKDPFLWSNQVFVFEADGHVKELASDKAIVPSAIQKLESAPATSSFTLNPKGILSITKIERSTPEKCACLFMTQNVPEALSAKVPDARRSQLPAKGDVMLSYLGKDGKPVLTKSLKKIR